MDHILYLGTLPGGDKPKELHIPPSITLLAASALSTRSKLFVATTHEGQLANKCIQKLTKGAVRAFGRDPLLLCVVCALEMVMNLMSSLSGD